MMTLMHLVLKTEIPCCNRPMGWSEVGSKGARYQPIVCIDFLACSPSSSPSYGKYVDRHFTAISRILHPFNFFVTLRDKGSTMSALLVSRN